MQLLKDRIRKDGKIKAGNVLKVDSFLNHQMDIKLFGEIGKEFKRRFADVEVNKILTIEASGIGIACIVAQYFDVPVVFAKKTQTKNIAGEVYTSKVESFTHGRVYDIIVSKEFLGKGDKVLLIDDFEFPFIDTADSHGFRSEIASEYTAFFECLREHEDRLRFLLMTGTTRYITTGFDWVFRWLTDITFDADTSDIVGFTRKDLETTFLPWVQRAAQTTGLTPVDVMDRLEAWYGGWRFSFEEKPPVLCPWMVMSYLRDPHERVDVDWQCYGRQRTVVLKFRDVWLERNILTLTDTIRLTKKELTEHKTDRDFRIELLMAQAGFYTIKSVDRDRMVTLTWPNAEGRRAMLASRAHRLLGRTMFAGWARAEDVPSDPLAAADYFSMLMNGISRQRFPVTDAFHCLRYLEILLADHCFDVEVSTDTDPMELRLAFQKRPAVFLFAWVVLEEDVETALSALERRIA